MRGKKREMRTVYSLFKRERMREYGKIRHKEIN